MSWNNGIPGGNFTINNNNTMNPIGTFSWTPTLADTANSPYFFTVSVTNQACPAPGSFSFQYQINVLGTDMVAIPTITNVSCNGWNDGIISVNTTGSLPPFSYSWFNGSTSTNINNLAVGTYNLQLTDFGGCSLTQTYTITEPLQITSSLLFFLLMELQDILISGMILIIKLHKLLLLWLEELTFVQLQMLTCVFSLKQLILALIHQQIVQLLFQQMLAVGIIIMVLQLYPFNQYQLVVQT